MDREVKSIYELLVTATDGGVPLSRKVPRYLLLYLSMRYGLRSRVNNPGGEGYRPNICRPSGYGLEALFGLIAQLV